MKTTRYAFITDDCRLHPYGEAASPPDTFKPLVLWITLIAFVLQPMLAAAQITLISPGGSVEKAPNGVTLIQIPTPSAAGVSHLLYGELNTSQAGMVFNNSQVVVQSQLAGFNEGNPNLVASPARTILNEVIGPLPSQLNGYMEIAGSKAELIVANPNGITCNGCGFINTTRGVLTTGTPVFGASGSLDALRVTGGQINLTGAGLNGSNTAQIDLIARAVKINAEFWGQKLNVIAGANQVDHNDLSTQTLTGTTPAPAVAIDVADLGGMYANTIRLVGTEAGVGVVSDGTLAAQAGDMTIDSAGYLTVNGTTQARGRLDLRAQQDLTNNGTLYAQGDAQLVSQAQISNRGTLAAQGNLTLAAERIASSGLLAAGMAADGRFNSQGSQGDLTLAARDTVSVQGTQAAGRNIEVSGRTLDLAGAKTWAGSDVSLTAGAGGIDHQGATLDAGGKVSLHSQGWIDNRRGVIKSQGRGGLALTSSGAIDNTSGYLSANDTLTVAADTLNNTAGTVVNIGSGAVQLNGSSSVINTAGYIGGHGNIDIHAPQLSNDEGKIISFRDARLDTSSLSGAGLVLAERDLSLNFGSHASNVAGNVLKANRHLTLASVGDFINQGTIEAVGTLTLNSASLDNRSGAKINAAETTITTRGKLNNAGSIQGTTLNIDATDLSNSGWIQPVEFSICNGELPCEPFVNVGSVANSGHGVVFPWIAKLSNKANRVVNYKPFLEQLITPGQTIYVRGFSHWLDRRNPSLFKGECGPRTSGFIPQQGRAYLIEFVWEGDTCRQVLYDATSPDSPELLSESDASVKTD